MRTTIAFAAVLGFVAVATSPESARAQAATSGGRLGVPITAEKTIQIFRAGRPTVMGTLISASPDSIVFVPVTGTLPVTYRADSLTRVSLFHGHSERRTGRGMAIGLGVGVAGAIALAASDDFFRGSGVMLSGIFGGTGMVIGGIFGSLTRREIWRDLPLNKSAALPITPIVSTSRLGLRVAF